MSRTAWWQPRARAWRWPPPTLRTCSTGCCSNGTVRSEEHTSELQSPCNLVCRLLSSKEHTSELQSPCNIVCRLLLEKKKKPPEDPWSNLHYGIQGLVIVRLGIYHMHQCGCTTCKM